MKLFGPLTRVPFTALLLLLALPTVANARAPDSIQDLLIGWQQVQVKWQRADRAEWWRRLDREQLNAFIDAGVDVTVADKRRWTPLHSAARYSTEPGIVSALLEAGADVGARNRAGDTPLHWAAAENANIDVVRILLQAGADIHQRDKFGWLPVHTAAESNPNPDVIAALLAAGSKRNKRAYFILFRPAFLLKHNGNMSKADKEQAMALLQGVTATKDGGQK